MASKWRFVRQVTFVLAALSCEVSTNHFNQHTQGLIPGQFPGRRRYALKHALGWREVHAGWC